VPWKFAFEMQRRGWYLRQDIVWSKPNPMPENVFDRCTKSHEFIFLFSKSKKYYFDLTAIKTQSSDGSLANPRSVWTVPVSRFSGAHFATYPPELIEPCILAGCTPGGTVLDPFAGSGTTAGVAIANNRHAVMIEANADYVDLINRRVDEIAGLKANPLFEFE
jgi:site-specific DNA-methyltransferase (adenine-specific)